MCQGYGHPYPPCLKILDIMSHLHRSFLKFDTNSIQSSYDAVKTRLRYLNDNTVFSGLPCSWNSSVALGWDSSSILLQSFSSSPSDHITMAGLKQFRAC